MGKYMEYEIRKDYRDDDGLRRSFNELAGKTFGLDFEDWYRNGFWRDAYQPYSVIADGKVAANVSVNRTDFVLDGRVRHFLQLGTVMTEEGYRNRGLIRKLMERIEEDYRGKAEGVYLFANDSVLKFYPKFGFRKSTEYQYGKKVSNRGNNRMEKVMMNNPDAWRRLEEAMEHTVFRGRFDMVNNSGLIMFYVTKFMQESVYYHKETDTYVIADVENGKLFLHNIFSGKLREAEEAAALFGEDIREIVLGFTPVETEGYEITEVREEDCTFFVKGKALEVIAAEKLRIPSLAHA